MRIKLKYKSLICILFYLFILTYLYLARSIKQLSTFIYFLLVDTQMLHSVLIIFVLFTILKLNLSKANQYLVWEDQASTNSNKSFSNHLSILLKRTIDVT